MSRLCRSARPRSQRAADRRGRTVAAALVLGAALVALAPPLPAAAVTCPNADGGAPVQSTRPTADPEEVVDPTAPAAACAVPSADDEQKTVAEQPSGAADAPYWTPPPPRPADAQPAPEGQSPDGEVGEFPNSDGSAPEVPDGDVSDSDVPDGDAPDGGLAERDGPEPDVPRPGPTVDSTPVPVAVPTELPIPKPSPSVPSRGGGAITRAEVMARAVSWVLQRVPYSQVRWWTDRNGTYRQDCSGYVSMAWHLDQRVNYWTGNLSQVSDRISTAALAPGDILLLPRSHTVIFGGWTDSTRTRFNLYEEYATGKPARFVVNASLSYYTKRGYGAFRYKRIKDSHVGHGAAGPAMQRVNSELPLDVGAEGELESQLWTPALAEQAESQSEAPSAAKPGDVTPQADPEVAVGELAAAQRAADIARLGMTAPRAASSALVYLVFGGLGVGALAVPLIVAVRTAPTRRRTVGGS